MRLHMMITRCAILVAGLALVPTLLLAQDGPSGRRIEEPTNPVDVGAGYDPFTWSTVTIPDLVEGAIPGTLWSDANGVIYVWTSRTLAVVPGGETPRDADVDPGPTPGGGGGTSTFVPLATLYRYDGTTWSTAMRLEGESPGTIFGVSPTEVYAATNLTDGTVAMYRYDGAAWLREPLPTGVLGPAGTIAGEHNNVYFRTGDSIFRERGGRWTRIHYDEQLLTGGELVYENGRMIAPGQDGYAYFDGATWQWKTLGFAASISGAAMARDASGVLHFFATGADPEARVVGVYELKEAAPYTLDGVFEPMDIGDITRVPRGGFGIEAFAFNAHDVYVTGSCAGCGCVHRFNGTAWSDICYVVQPMPLVTGIGGDALGNLAMALKDGRLLLGTRRDPLPATVNGGSDHGGDAQSFAVHQERNNVAVIEFTLPQPERVSLAVYNVAGRRVTLLDRSVRDAGRHQVRWDANGAAPGIYFCRLTTAAGSSGRTILVGR